MSAWQNLPHKKKKEKNPKKMQTNLTLRLFNQQTPPPYINYIQFLNIVKEKRVRSIYIQRQTELKKH